MRWFFTISRVTALILLMSTSSAFACRMWGLVWTDPANPPTPEAYSQIINLSFIPTIEGIWNNNSWDGWSICWYDSDDSLRINRGNAMPWTGEDERWIDAGEGPVLDSLITQCPQIAFMHLRLASSGSDDDPNPHPFVYNVFDKKYSFQHNGTISGSRWSEVMEAAVIGQYFMNLPIFAERNYINHGNPDPVVDSEYLGIAYLKNILIAENYGKNIEWAIKQTAKEIIRADFISGEMFDFNSINGLLVENESLRGITIPNSDSYNLWYRIFDEIPGRPCVILNWNPDEFLWSRLHDNPDYQILKMIPGQDPVLSEFDILLDNYGTSNELLKISNENSGIDLQSSIVRIGDNKFLATWYEKGGQQLSLRQYNQLGLSQEHESNIHFLNVLDEIDIPDNKLDLITEDIFIFALENINSVETALSLYKFENMDNNYVMADSISFSNNSTNFYSQIISSDKMLFISNTQNTFENNDIYLSHIDCNSLTVTNDILLQNIGKITDTDFHEDIVSSILASDSTNLNLITFGEIENQIVIHDTLVIPLCEENLSCQIINLNNEKIVLLRAFSENDLAYLKFNSYEISEDLSLSQGDTFQIQLPDPVDYKITDVFAKDDELISVLVNGNKISEMKLNIESQKLISLNNLCENNNITFDNEFSTIFYPESSEWPERLFTTWSFDDGVQNLVYGKFTPDHFNSSYYQLNRFFTESQSPGEIVEDPVIPSRFGIESIYPNPCNSSASVLIKLPYTANISVDLFNILGQESGTIYNGILSAGIHRLGLTNQELSSGCYFVILKTPGGDFTQKIIITR